MENKPKLKLEIDKKADINMAVGFVEGCLKEKDVDFAKWFLPEQLHFILEKGFTKKEREKIVRKYAEYFYSQKIKEIKVGLKNSKKNWEKVEDKYFKLAGKIFKNHPWPKSYYKEGYCGMPTIFRMYPRFIDRKYFFFPYNHEVKNFTNYTIAHELLHFIFFDYIDKKYGIKEHDEFAGKHERYVWQISEAFNVVIENWSPYFRVIKVPTTTYTKEQEVVYRKMKKQWTEKQDIDRVLDQWFLGLKKK